MGSILEYRLKIRYPEDKVSEPEWDVQLPYFIHKEHFSFHTHATSGVEGSNGETLDRLMVSWQLPDKTAIDHGMNSDLYSLDFDECPAGSGRGLDAAVEHVEIQGEVLLHECEVVDAVLDGRDQALVEER